jgi:hypothetical protein
VENGSGVHFPSSSFSGVHGLPLLHFLYLTFNPWHSDGLFHTLLWSLFLGIHSSSFAAVHVQRMFNLWMGVCLGQGGRGWRKWELAGMALNDG